MSEKLLPAPGLRDKRSGLRFAPLLLSLLSAAFISFFQQLFQCLSSLLLGL